MAGPELRVGHYAVALEGWGDEALPCEVTLRFAVRDPDAKKMVTISLTQHGVTCRVLG